MSTQKSILNYFTKSPNPAKENGLKKAVPNFLQSPLSNQQIDDDIEMVDSFKTPKRKTSLNTSVTSKSSQSVKNLKKFKTSPKSSPDSNFKLKRKIGENKQKNFKRIKIESDDEESEKESGEESKGSDEDYNPVDESESSEEETSDVSSEELKSPSEESFDSEEAKEEQRISKTCKKQNFKTTASLSQITKARLEAFSANKLQTDGDASFSGNDQEKDWIHLSFDFLKPEYIMDKNKRRPNHPDYDSKTLYVPESFIRKQTPAHIQWWNMKSDHFDTILFFKMGKFYEVFHMDAVIAVKELNLLFMKGDYAHAGFPEKSYKRFSDVMLTKGYKIGRIEQTETPEQRDERCKNQKKADKVVSRELCRITTMGTRTCSVLDAEPSSFQSSFLLAISEEEISEDIGNKSRIGICFIDTSIGRFYLGQFVDDRYCSKLRTLFSYHPPVELILEKKRVSSKLQQAISYCLPSVVKTMLKPKKEFWDSSHTLKIIQEEYYKDSFPQTLLKMIDENDALRQKAKLEYNLAIKALGACIFYLKECLIDEEMLTMKLFEEFKPLDEEKNNLSFKSNMILDSITLKNLEIFENSLGSVEGTLFETIDHCSTKFGKRLLRLWLCSPLCDINQINERLDAIEDLRQSKVFCEIDQIIDLMHKLPDLERILSKIHTQGCSRRSKSHPDSRAVLFDIDVYSKRKIIDFISVIDGFKKTFEIRANLDKLVKNFKSSILKKCIQFEPDGNFPNVHSVLIHYDQSFDHNLAKKEGRIIPKDGVDTEYDQSLQNLAAIEKKLEKYRLEECKKLNCKVNYCNSGKSRYQLEIPDHAAKRIGDEYLYSGQRKGFKRFYTEELKELLVELTSAEEKKEKILQDTMRRLFESFDKNYHHWISIIKCISLIDCLISLTLCSKSMEKYGSNICRPQFESKVDNIFISIKQGRHPCLLKYTTNFIPNDFHLENELLFLTGPNMGGKSTLMRQTGLISIMAQMGCFVPAQSCSMFIIDRIFTRLGAYDRIMEGESTFFVELSETSLILQHASSHSLVLLDELGRGTSTFDGTAIASAVVYELITNINCRSVFSTHYHSMVEHFSNNPKIKFGHMACMIESENEEDPTEECITFLYQLCPGPCPKSYGFNAAKLAGIPLEIIRKAHEKAKEFETFSKTNQLLFKLVKENLNVSEMKKIIISLNQIEV